MPEILRPENPEQLLQSLRWAVSENRPLALCGRGSKKLMGRPTKATTQLDLSGLSGITLYEPGELVLTALAGTSLLEIEKALAKENQELAFEPPNYAALLKQDPAEKGSIGGLFACNLAGPRRLKSGAARDHILGFKAVSGRGEAFKSGGRVVKNVTGYDLSKLMAGSWGTLAAMGEITFKILPKAEKTRTVLLLGADAETATGAMTAALCSSHEISAAAWLPENLVRHSDVEILKLVGRSVTALRIEGPAPSVVHRCKAVRALLRPIGKIEELHSKNSLRFWREIRDVHAFARPDDDRVIWRISCAPQSGWKILHQLRDLKGVESCLDWAGGLIWLAVDAPNVGAEGLIRDAVNLYGGHATLIRGSERLRQNVPVFHRPNSGVMELTRRLKRNFDPYLILNPGRMYEGL